MPEQPKSTRLSIESSKLEGVLAIVAYEGDYMSIIGSGIVIGPEFALTAKHVVEGIVSDFHYNYTLESFVKIVGNKVEKFSIEAVYFNAFHKAVNVE